MRRTRRLLRALASLLGLAATMGGLPALLIGVVGWPLPRRLPTAEQVRSALGDGWRPDERFVLSVLALLLWLLWAQLLRHVLSQFRFQLRLQRAAIATGDEFLPQVAFTAAPRRGLGPRIAGWLVGGLMMASPLLPSAATASPRRPVPVVMTVTRATADPLLSPAATAEPPSALAVRSAPSYVVHTWAERRDCLWNIADRYLGDPFRWTEIRDLNADRVQLDGRTLGEDPSSWVYPGWELALPADANGVDVVPVSFAPASGAPTSPATSPAPSSSSPMAVSPGPSNAAVPTTPVPAPSTSASPTTSVAAGGVAASSPPSIAPPPASSSTTSSTAVPARAAAPPASIVQAPPTTGPGAKASTAGSRRVVAVNPWATRAAMAGALGLPIFALGGWLARLRRGRAAQASRVRPGRDVVRTADPEVETLERRARAIAADQAEEWIDAALRALTAALGDCSLAATPQVRCVRAGEMGVEVLLAEPFPVAPPGWVTADGGHVWHPAPDVTLDELRAQGAEHPALTPALVSLGATPEGPILADLEGFGALAVDGDPARVSAFLAGAALELASATWAQGVDLRVYGLAGFERLDVAVTDGDELLREARSTAQLVGEGLASHTSALGARIHSLGAEEPWYPMVVVVGSDAEPGVVCDLVEVAAARTGVVVAAAGAQPGAEWHLLVSPDGTAVLKPLDLDVLITGVSDLTSMATKEPAASAVSLAAGQQVEAARAEHNTAPEAHADVVAPAVVDLLAVDQGGLDPDAIGAAVGALATVSELDDIAPPTPFAAPTRARRARLRRREDCEVWVSVLRRTPEVTGWVNELRGRRKLAEVLVYLAIYGTERPIPSAELRTNCWPPMLVAGGLGERDSLREVSASTFHQAMSRLRKQLGEGANGWHLPLAPDGGYGIGPGVGCDWTLFRALVDAGAHAAGRRDTPQAIALYREALELVEGEPFADVPPGSCAWAEAKPLVTDIRLAVSKAASDLAELAMDSEPETALWATQQGLLLLPTQLELFDCQMHAAAALGDAGALDRSVQAKCWAHEQLDPEGGVPPETMDLYRHLKAKLAGREMAGRAGGGRG